MKNPLSGLVSNNPFTRIAVALERIANKMATINADALVAAVSTFTTDFSKFSDDFAKFLANIPVNDPATQNKIDTATTALTGFDTQVKALDALVNPPADNGGGTPAGQP